MHKRETTWPSNPALFATPCGLRASSLEAKCRKVHGDLAFIPASGKLPLVPQGEDLIFALQAWPASLDGLKLSKTPDFMACLGEPVHPGARLQGFPHPHGLSVLRKIHWIVQGNYFPWQVVAKVLFL